MMSQVSDKYKTKICRLCLAKTLIHFPLNHSNEASKMLEALTTMRILSTDEISTVSCLKCVLNLKLAFATQQNMLTAERRFRALNSVKQECDFQEEENNTQNQNFEPPESKPAEKMPEKFICDICNCVKPTRKLLSNHKYNAHMNRQCPCCFQEVKTSAFRYHIVKCKAQKDLQRILKLEENDSDVQKIAETDSENIQNDLAESEKITEVNIKTENVEIEPNSSKIIIKTKKKDPNKLYTCDMCGCVKPSKRLLGNHKYAVHATRRCPNCNEHIKTSSYRGHMVKCISADNIKNEDDSEVDKIETHICDICGVIKPSRLLLKRHKNRIHTFRQCLKCGKNIKVLLMSLHLSQCEKTFEGKPGNYVCDICGITKLTKWQLSKHKYNAHLREKCPICEKVITKTNLTRHIERHQEDLTVCEQCGKSVIRQDLRSHMRTHSNITFKCRYCEKSYRAKSRREYHENKEHLDIEAAFVCDTCGKKFHRKVYLKRHIESTHLKLKPYICEYCKTGFSTRFGLKTHLRQHTNETPYRCEECGEAFRQRVSLKTHLKMKHGVEEELKYECTVCGKKFGSNWALFSHSRVHP